MEQLRKHLFIPDCQVTPESPTDHLAWTGEYIVEKKPDVIVNIGDFADMPSLSSYDYGKKKHEGKRYKADIEASHNGMNILCAPMMRHNNKMRLQKMKMYSPEMHLTIGNHEYRIERAIEADAKMDGHMGMWELNYEAWGWKVHDFLVPVEIDGVSYCHYFCLPQSGNAIGGSIENKLNKIGYTFCAGHQQMHQIGIKPLNNGARIRGLVSGACYLHDEDYRGAQCNSEWRGVIMLHEVHNGDYVLNEVSLDYLCRKYEGLPLWQFMKNKYPKIFNESLWMKRQASMEN